MVTGIDLPQFKAALRTDGASCVSPDGDLENLSHFVQAYFHNAGYIAPLLAGIAGDFSVRGAGAGAEEHFCGSVTSGFCPSFHRDKPPCEGSGSNWHAAGFASVSISCRSNI